MCSDNVALLVLPALAQVASSLERFAAMVGNLLGESLYGVLAVAGVILVLGLVALFRCKREDIPLIIQSLATWWRR